ncbi:hypothetical protein RB595_005772 [Gaeumannomyces hyphopodioides]
MAGVAVQGEASRNATQTGDSNRQYSAFGGTQKNVEGNFYEAARDIIFMSSSSETSPEEQFLEALLEGSGFAGTDIVPPERGTCSWILAEDFRDWERGHQNNPLWIYGPPGNGKSVMTSFILRERQKWAPLSEEAAPGTKGSPSKKTIVAASFCDRNPSRRAPIWILRTLLYEVLKQNRELFDTVRSESDFWQDSDPQHPTLNPDAFQSMSLLANLLGGIAADDRVAGTYFIVDGQYPRTKDAADLCDLIKLVSSHHRGTSPLRWIISTRPNDFDRTMDEVYPVDLLKKNRGDISQVAMSRMERLRKFNPAITESFRDEVVEILKQRADGMFLWLSLALDSLEEEGTIWDMSIIKEKLQNIPYDVQVIYGKVFENADKKVQTLMRWIFLAGRPLKVGEVLVMWALQDGAGSIQAIENKSLRPESVRNSIQSSLKGLLTLHEDDTIHVAHPSVKDFIAHLFGSSEQPQQGKREDGITKTDTHKQMAELCLDYLSFDEVRNLEPPEPPIDESGMIDREKRDAVVNSYLEKYVFLEYSIKFLGLHLRESGKDGVQVANLRGMDQFFGANSLALQNWVRGYDLLMRWTHGKYTGASSGLSLLFISARLNLISLAERSISPSGFGALPSVATAVPGLGTLVGGVTAVAAVRQRIIDMPDMTGWRALHMAVDSESEEVVRWLLENGASADSATIGIIRPGRTALHLAASKSSEAGVRIVRELLKNGANPGVPTMFGGNTPLHYAVQAGSAETVRALLLHKPSGKQPAADPNMPNHSGITALHKAVVIPGMDAIVEILLENGANPEKPSALDKVAVVRGVKAAKKVSISALKRTSLQPAAVLDMAADAVRGAVTNETALHMAVRVRGTEETVKKQLEWYTKNNKPAMASKDSMGRTPLHAAVCGGGFATHTKLLVESGIVSNSDINAQDKDGKTPLSLYVQRLSQPGVLSELGDPAVLGEVFGTLLDAGASPWVRDRDGKSAVDYAKHAGLTWAVERCGAELPPSEDVEPARPAGCLGGCFGGCFALFRNMLGGSSKKKG